MERLTRYNSRLKRWVLPQGMWREITDTLKAYEDTGLTPSEIMELKKLSAQKRPPQRADYQR